MDKKTRTVIWKRYKIAREIHAVLEDSIEEVCQIFSDGYDLGIFLAKDICGSIISGEYSLQDLPSQISQYDFMLNALSYRISIEDGEHPVEIMKELLHDLSEEESEFVDKIYSEGIFWGLSDGLARLGIAIEKNSGDIVDIKVSLRKKVLSPCFIKTNNILCINEKYETEVGK